MQNWKLVLTTLLAQAVSILAHAQECPLKPEPTYHIDFTAAEIDETLVFHGDARIVERAPKGVTRALRIDSDGSAVVVPGVDISPPSIQSMKDVTISIAVYLESIKPGNLGWIVSHDNGEFDRAIILHDSRVNGMGLSTGGYEPGKPLDLDKVYPEMTLPELHKWIHIIGVFRQDGDCEFYLDGVKAPLTAQGEAKDGLPDLYIGQPLAYTKHWSDAWVKDVQVYDRALQTSEVEALFCEFEGSFYGNVALNKPVFLSSTAHGAGNKYSGSKCTDGVTDNEATLGPFNGICMTTWEREPSLTVKLGNIYEIDRIFIYNRDGDCSGPSHGSYSDCASYLSYFKLEIFSGNSRVWGYSGGPNPGLEIDIPIPQLPKGDTIKLHLFNSLEEPLHIREIEVYGRYA